MQSIPYTAYQHNMPSTFYSKKKKTLQILGLIGVNIKFFGITALMYPRFNRKLIGWNLALS